MSRFVVISSSDDGVTLRCPVCDVSETYTHKKFKTHVFFSFYRRHIIAHINRK